MKRAKINLTAVILIIASCSICLVGGYFAARWVFNQYFESWGNKLILLEKEGRLSRNFGAGWKDVITQKAMDKQAQRIISGDSTVEPYETISPRYESNADFPSLSIIEQLNELREYSNEIRITDRRDSAIARIRTAHRRATSAEFPQVLVTALIAAEDQEFFKNNIGISFNSYMRAIARAVVRSITTASLASPRGTSTITQQVAKLFISDLDTQGRRFVKKSVSRKIKEMKLTAAIRKMYTSDQILEIYLNHCITSDYGLIGVKDIAFGLFGKDLDQLTDAQCLYLARMVKWGRNIKDKIVAQCIVDMPRMAAALKWDNGKQKTVITELRGLTFLRPQQIPLESSHLIDLANEFWLLSLQKNGADDEQLAQMDLLAANSLIRKKGNCTIKLTIDLPLQRELERLVAQRGFGHDTTFVTDVRIGSTGETIRRNRLPRDTLRHISVLADSQCFSEPTSFFKTCLGRGDTLVTNIRYKRLYQKLYRRSAYFYVRKPLVTKGQYFAYSIMDSKSGELLAYYCRDRIAARASDLLYNRIPNGSSTAKPIFNALVFDQHIFLPFARINDSAEVTDDVPWKRSFIMKDSVATGMLYANSAVRGKSYEVHNHNNIFDGCNYIFDMLATSNNIFAVETQYRLNSWFLKDGSVRDDAASLADYFTRIGALDYIRDTLQLSYVTGVRMYRELARKAGASVDSIPDGSRTIPLSDSMYSAALGTIELSLYEQMHLFNTLYNNELIVRPAQHPTLVITSITLNNTPIPINDTIERIRPFADYNNIRPTLLGMHKRLCSPTDGLDEFDVPMEIPLDENIGTTRKFSPEALALFAPVANYAKSGTSDDIIRPYNISPDSKKKTNYGLWNATIRIDLSRLNGDTLPDVRDVTISCVGECNTATTGARDGKTLHKYVSQSLLQKAGPRCTDGFFRIYEEYLRRVTPDDMMDCQNDPAIKKSTNPIKGFFDFLFGRKK